MTELPLNERPEGLGERTVFEGEIVPLYDLFRAVAAKGATAIDGHTFRNCRIDGPAVLLAHTNNTFDGCHFGEMVEPEALLLRPMSQTHLTGAIPVVNSRFEACNFYSIGFTGAENFLEDLRRVLTELKAAQ